MVVFFFFSSRRRHTRFDCDWSSDVCSSDLPAVAEVAVARTANGPEDRPREQDAPAKWDKIDWRAQEGQVRRLRQRIFKASQEGDWPKVRNLQKLTAPRGALLYPRLSREEFEGRFLGLMPYLE